MLSPMFRRLSPAAGNDFAPELDESRLLPVMAHLAGQLLAARAQGDDPAGRAATLADLGAAGLTAAECLELVSQGLLADSICQARKGSAERKSISANGRRSSRSRATSRCSGDCSPSASRNGRDEGGSKSLQGKKASRAAASKPLRVGPRTRLHLTDAGLAWITKHAQSGWIEFESAADPLLGPSISPSSFLPHFDVELRELSVAGVVILRLPLQARNLTAVLTALEVSGWKAHVKKPLNGSRGGNDHHHLANAALSLNDHQTLVEFGTDDGAIRWAWQSAPRTAAGHNMD